MFSKTNNVHVIGLLFHSVDRNVDQTRSKTSGQMETIHSLQNEITRLHEKGTVQYDDPWVKYVKLKGKNPAIQANLKILNSDRQIRRHKPTA
jgi:hypothetical protein